MKKIYQTKFGDEGNCFAACIASLFEVKIEEVPFLSDYEDWCSYEKVLNEYLKSKFQVILLYSNYNAWWTEYLEENFKDAYYIVSGDSTAEGLEHAVVYKNGELVHNPNNTGTELLNIKNIWMFLKIHF